MAIDLQVDRNRRLWSEHSIHSRLLHLRKSSPARLDDQCHSDRQNMNQVYHATNSPSNPHLFCNRKAVCHPSNHHISMSADPHHLCKSFRNRPRCSQFSSLLPGRHSNKIYDRHCNDGRRPIDWRLEQPARQDTVHCKEELYLAMSRFLDRERTKVDSKQCFPGHLRHIEMWLARSRRTR